MFTSDVVIVGGGPAGAAVALALARRGLSPIVLESEPGPTLKVGECLPPNINPLLDHFGLTRRLRQQGNLPSHGNQFAWGSDSIQERDFIFEAAGDGWRLDRQAFERELMCAAAEAGARWRSGRRLIACSRENDRFELSVKSPRGTETYLTDSIVDATGRSAQLARALGARRFVYDRLIGIASYFQGRDTHAGAEEDSFTLVEAVASGWWYSSRLPAGKLIAVYMSDGDLVAARRADDWVALLNETKHTVQRACKYDDPTPPRIVAAHTVRLTRVAGDGWLAVGDSAVSFDPLASHGISMAMGSGFHAASAIVDYLDGRPNALRVYERLIDGAFAHYLLMRHDAYSRERRWPQELFWRRRHAPDFGPVN
jgi:flavin-dependent dehydrogenase